jgi:hypothetical protein
LGVGEDALQQHLPMSAQSFDGRFIEEVGVVLERAGQPLSTIEE